MQDGIIAGNGNSRYLKTVAAALTLYPTYQDFMAALIAGTFPIDLNGINQAGWSQLGTALNKASLLTDATAAALGVGTGGTPDGALNALLGKITAVSAQISAQIVIGSYAGDGQASRLIVLGFQPRAVMVFGSPISNTYSQYASGVALPGIPATGGYMTPQTRLAVAANGFSVAQYMGSDNMYADMNFTGKTYVYIAIR